LLRLSFDIAAKQKVRADTTKSPTPNHADRGSAAGGVADTGGVWGYRADAPLALAELLGPGGRIYAVDRDQGALRSQVHAMHTRFPNVMVHYQIADFTDRLDLPSLDGIVMANALHFVPSPRKDAVVRRLKSYLRPGGRLILVMNVDQGNSWVPYPLSYFTWEDLARRNGFADVRLLATAPSRFLHEFYSAAAW
jgi:SAM-dependent methyltransferase